jgi:TetR/AcrR family transcriptional repressor of nem operon
MTLFWEQGYHATSTRELADVMGLNPYSLYAEFGSKEALYGAAIDHYEQTVVSGHFGRLETEDSSLEDIRAVLDFFGDSGDRRGSHLGCLLCNAGTELAPTVEESRVSTDRYLARLTSAFANALGNAAREARLKESTPIDELAAFFSTLLMGQFVLMRAQVDRSIVRGASNQALSRLDEVTAETWPNQASP